VTGVRGGRAGEWVAGVDVAVAARLAETSSDPGGGGVCGTAAGTGQRVQACDAGPHPHTQHTLSEGRPDELQHRRAGTQARAPSPARAAGGGPLGDA